MSNESQRPIDIGRGFGHEHLDPRHTYFAYVFDNPGAHQFDLEVLISEAKRRGYPTRYWWLSDAVQLHRQDPDRLIVCVHHPTADENTGMDLYEALEKNRVVYAELEKASFEEYVVLSEPLRGIGDIATPGGSLVFPKTDFRETPERLDYDSIPETTPVFDTTLGDIQSFAIAALGRVLTQTEVRSIAEQLREQAEHKLSQLVFAMDLVIEAGQRLSSDGQPEDYLVYYSLGGLAMVRAVSPEAAANGLLTNLHGTISGSEQEGISPSAASQLRLSELDMTIESVEAMPFPTDDQ